MSHVETTIMAIMWNLLGMWEVSVHFQYSNYNISPEASFKTENMLWLILGEGTIFMFTGVLSLRDIPTNKPTPRRTKFYVHNPGALEPRRPPSLHGDIIEPKTAKEKGDMNKLSNSPITICVPQSTQHKQTKMPLITLVKEYQTSDEMKCADEISSSQDIIETETARDKSSMKRLSNSPINICVPKNTHHKRTKIPPITVVKEYQS